ncbi:MAG: type I-E CRISPR-associated protein Cas7/Cse4/CasC [Bryobacteraceae bacterium]|nr:type I-E CRISPR-associated protein Cas7/Cse4/CasC [Bryobacteraceae bacterium]
MSVTKNFLAVHWLQTLPVSNPNRDRTGAPKTTYYGGSIRGRISSQCWSREVRETFNRTWDGDSGTRSRLWPDRIAQRLSEEYGYNRNDALTLAFLILSSTGAKTKDMNTFQGGQSDVLMFLSGNELEEMVALAQRYKLDLDQALEILRPGVQAALEAGKGAPSLELSSGKKGKGKARESSEPGPDLGELHKRVKNFIENNRSAADIALFGRFMASLNEARIDGALARSHMETTHSAAVETDFWTALDDFGKSSGDDEDDDVGSGAGHMGDRPQTSGVYAGSCALDLSTLRENLGKDGDVAKAVNHFLKALITAPRGKGYIHQFHHRSLPAVVVAELTEACPLNCAVAFEKPTARGERGGYLINSVKQLDSWWHNQHTLLAGLVETRTWAVADPEVHEQLAHLKSHLKPNYVDLLLEIQTQLEG